MREREKERQRKCDGQGRKGSASRGATVERTKKRSQGEPPSRRRPWTTFLIATSSCSSPRSHQHASELLRTIRTKGKQFSVDAAAAANAYLVTPSAVSAYRAPSPTLSLPAYSFPRTGANFCPLPRRDLSPASPHPSRATAARLHGPPLFSVQQVARSFKTCRRSFVRFKKPKHQQSSALRRQDRYPHREQSSGVVGGRKMR